MRRKKTTAPTAAFQKKAHQKTTAASALAEASKVTPTNT